MVREFGGVVLDGFDGHEDYDQDGEGEGPVFAFAVEEELFEGGEDGFHEVEREAGHHAAELRSNEAGCGRAIVVGWHGLLYELRKCEIRLRGRESDVAAYVDQD